MPYFEEQIADVDIGDLQRSIRERNNIVVTNPEAIRLESSTESLTLTSSLWYKAKEGERVIEASTSLVRDVSYLLQLNAVSYSKPIYNTDTVKIDKDTFTIKN